MSLIGDLRLDYGDDDDVVYPTGSIPGSQPIPDLCPDSYQLVADLRIDVGDDDNIVYPTGSIASIPLNPNLCPETSLLITDVRIDVGDDEDIAYPTGSVVIAPPAINACAETYLLLTDIRLDIGDDEDVDYGIVNPPLPEPECPEIWCTRVVTSSSYQVAQDDVFIFVNPTITGPTTITLSSSPILGQVIIIKDIKGDAITNNITVAASPNLIDGFSSFTISQNKQSIMITWNGTEWNIV